MSCIFPVYGFAQGVCGIDTLLLTVRLKSALFALTLVIYQGKSWRGSGIEARETCLYLYEKFAGARVTAVLKNRAEEE